MENVRNIASAMSLQHEECDAHTGAENDYPAQDVKIFQREVGHVIRSRQVPGQKTSMSWDRQEMMPLFPVAPTGPILR